MFRIIGSTVVLAGLMLGASPAAEAHGAHYRNYDAPGYQYGVFHRKRHMPGWLWHKRGFRHWYFRTPLRFDRHLGWRQLYDAYRWERRYNHRRHYRAHYRDYRHDHWRGYEDRERRPRQRRRHRDD